MKSLILIQNILDFPLNIIIIHNYYNDLTTKINPFDLIFIDVHPMKKILIIHCLQNILLTYKYIIL